MLILARFNQLGIARFNDALDETRRGADLSFNELTADALLIEQISTAPVISMREFANRYEAGKYFYELFANVDFGDKDPERDSGLWTWLAAVWLDVLAPVSGTQRALGANARYVLEADNYKRYYRHLLAAPYRIYRAHRDNPERAMAVLATPVQRPGDAVEQLASRQEIVSNPNLMEVVTRLYYDSSTGKLKRGSGTKHDGSPRRFARDTLPQFDLTYDFYGMEASQVLRLLPKEYSRFMPEG
jgi:hypothetical protein